MNVHAQESSLKPTADVQTRASAVPESNSQTAPDGPEANENVPPSGAAAGDATRPGLVLDGATQGLYADIIERLDERSRRHQKSATIILCLIVASVVGAIALIAFARTILGSDLETARLNEALLNDIESQKRGVEAKLAARNKRTEELKAKFDSEFGLGHIWAQAELPKELTSRLFWVHLAGSSGFAVGDKQFVFTIDGGTSWSLPTLELEKNDSFEANTAGYGLGSDDKLFGWIAGNRGKIAKSGSSIKEWRVVSIKRPDGALVDGDVFSVFFRNPKTGWAAGGNGLLAKTTDGGDNWQQVESNTGSTLYQVKFFADDVGIAIGTDLIVLLTYDGGATWQNETKAIAALNPGNGSLTLQVIDATDPGRSYADVRQIMIGGSNGLLLVGERAGAKQTTWKLGQLAPGKFLNGAAENVNTIRWIEPLAGTSNVIAVGDRGTLLVSTDRGSTWRIEPGERPTLLYAQSFSPDKVMIAGARGYIAQLELTANASSAKLTVEETPDDKKIFYQLSPRNQTQQVAAGDGILRRVTLSEVLLYLRVISEADKFRELAVGAQSKDLLLDRLPKSSKEYTSLTTMISDLQHIDDDVKTLRNDIPDLDRRRNDVLQKDPIKPEDFMLWLTGARALVVVIAFFLIRFLISLYRYHNNQSAIYEARGDALRSARFLPATVGEVAAWFAPGSLEDSGSNMVQDVLAAIKGMAGKG